MNLNKLFEDLSYGELSNLSVGGSGSGGIPEGSKLKLLSHTNKGLEDLFTRMNLLEKEVVVTAKDEVTLYFLRKEHAQTNVEVGFEKYLTDTVDDPYIGDLVKVMTVYNEIGEALPINNPEDEESLYLPKFDCLQIPYPVTGNTYFVMYQARHPVLVPDNWEQEIDLPLPLEAALRHFVAHRVFGGMNGVEHRASAAEHLNAYAMLLDTVESKDLARTSQMGLGQQFDMRGWR